jgi:hypothetical protein
MEDNNVVSRAAGRAGYSIVSLKKNFRGQSHPPAKRVGLGLKLESTMPVKLDWTTIATRGLKPLSGVTISIIVHGVE